MQVKDGNKPVFANMNVINAVDHKNISKTANDNIKKGSTIKSDGWPAYNALKEQVYEQEKIIIGDPKKASELLPWVHTLIAKCKGILRGVHHGVSARHLQLYLSEFCYRFNRRFNPLKLFDRAVSACLVTNTVTFAELTK